MSFFGKNIKAIRKLNSYSQQEFGALFDIKRGTLGAYEEGRSEPKIDTIIKVAHHFNLSIDLLLTRELTKNELSEYLQNGNEVSNDRSLHYSIPCLGVQQIPMMIKNQCNPSYQETLPFLNLPYPIQGKFLGLIIDEVELLRHDLDFYPSDILIGEYVDLRDTSYMEDETIAFAFLEDELLLGRFEQKEDTYVLKGTQMLSVDREIQRSEIIHLYIVRSVYHSRLPNSSTNVLDKLDFLQAQIESIRKSVKL